MEKNNVKPNVLYNVLHYCAQKICKTERRLIYVETAPYFSLRKHNNWSSFSLHCDGYSSFSGCLRNLRHWHARRYGFRLARADKILQESLID
jgi:hypothetical protein